MIKLPDRYSLVKTLNGGGMSDTLLCKDSHLDRSVVIKSLKPGIEKHRLLDELAALSDIRSKHVVQVLDVIQDEGEIVAFVEEHIDGQPLSPLDISKGANETLRVLYSIAAGVSDVHFHNRLHRDLKPENMMFDSSGVLKLFDFGLSKLATNAYTKQLYYSNGYSAPEIFKQNVKGDHVFTTAVDVFAIGATAAWLLNNGVLPAGMEDIPPSLPCPIKFANFSAGLSQPICDALDLCLEKEASKRPTAHELQALMERYILFNQHRMLLTHKGAETVIDKFKPSVKLAAGTDSVAIIYDGLDFKVSAVSGHALRNNRQVKVGELLTGASVIVLGDPNGDKRDRTSITADVTHPEVIL